MSRVSLETVASRICYIQMQVAGVNTAYSFDVPNKLNSADLPLFINIPTEATVDYSTSGMATETRFWYMLLYVHPIQRPHELALRLSTVSQLIDNTYETFQQHPALSNLDFIQSAHIVSDSGIISLSYGNVQYSGVEFKLQVNSISNIAYT